ncbi:hypothetical protein BY996DRAFT_6561076 [Phakopsora pachyrhizi]|nr:hypothetical protein BY996DRAFT_6561076 [Phakopsora pachyrhizi]
MRRELLAYNHNIMDLAMYQDKISKIEISDLNNRIEMLREMESARVVVVDEDLSEVKQTAQESNRLLRQKPDKRIKPRVEQREVPTDQRKMTSGKRLHPEGATATERCCALQARFAIKIQYVHWQFERMDQTHSGQNIPLRTFEKGLEGDEDELLDDKTDASPLSTIDQNLNELIEKQIELDQTPLRMVVMKEVQQHRTEMCSWSWLAGFEACRTRLKPYTGQDKEDKGLQEQRSRTVE